MLPQSNSYQNLGGELADYQPVTDPTTDRAAAAENDAFADVAAMTRMAFRAYVTFTIAATVGTVIDHDAVWGNDVSVKPTIGYLGSAGGYSITWPASVTDARGISRSVNLRRGLVNVAQSNGTGSLSTSGPNTATLRLSVAGALADPTGAVTAWVN